MTEPNKHNQTPQRQDDPEENQNPGAMEERGGEAESGRTEEATFSDIDETLISDDQVTDVTDEDIAAVDLSRDDDMY